MDGRVAERPRRTYNRCGRRHGYPFYFRLGMAVRASSSFSYCLDGSGFHYSGVPAGFHSEEGTGNRRKRVAFNDATGSIITFALIAAITGKSALEAGPLLYEFAYTALGGIALGLLIGAFSVFMVAHLKLGILRDYTTIAMQRL